MRTFENILTRWTSGEVAGLSIQRGRVRIPHELLGMLVFVPAVEKGHADGSAL